MLYRFLNTSYKQVITARLNGSGRNVSVPDGGRAEVVLIRAMFTLLGKVAKLNGQVTPGEVSYATGVMSVMGLDERGRQKAIDHFNQGKRPIIDVKPLLVNIARHIDQRSELALLFLKIQCQGACIDGGIGLREKMMLRDAAEVLAIAKPSFREYVLEPRPVSSLLRVASLRLLPVKPTTFCNWLRGLQTMK
ncbi:MAG: TerB family tellurite resistance protein [Gammaproteobacteria bacterium]|nr:TerB family tellurite resistance protein [Gammaproteobacteria bacterium]